jgi:hypothetical protein
MGLTHRGLHRDGLGPKRTDDTFGQACRIAFAPLGETNDFFSNRCRDGSLTVSDVNRFKTSSKATVMAVVSSGPNAVLISRRVIGISLTYGCESEKLPDANEVRHPDVPLLS